MTRKYFGTDGIRGLANKVITPELALKVGQAAGQIFKRGDHRHRVVIGKDTRLSGYMIETALVAGFTSVGMDVLLLGPMPTPAVGMLTRSMRADLGVMISASHNPFDDNGIKLFGPDGFKLSDEIESEIEQLIDSDHVDAARQARRPRPRQAHRRRARPLHRIRQAHAAARARASTACASWSIAPTAPPTRSRRPRCGSWAPKSSRSASSRTASTSTTSVGSTDAGAIANKVRGDARRYRHRARWRCRSRAASSTRRGQVVDGDQLLAVIAESWKEDGRLQRQASSRP